MANTVLQKWEIKKFLKRPKSRRIFGGSINLCVSICDCFEALVILINPKEEW